MESLPADFVEAGQSIIAMDPPQHSTMRRLVASTFTPRQMKRTEGRIRANAAMVVDNLIAKAKASPDGVVDFVGECAALLPMHNISDLVGLPDGERQKAAHEASVGMAWNDPEMTGNDTTRQSTSLGLRALTDTPTCGPGCSRILRAGPRWTTPSPSAPPRPSPSKAEAMTNEWFETVAVAQRRAKRKLPPSVYGALIAGSEAGRTVRDNVEAFDEIGFAPHAAGLRADRAQATTVMGQDMSMPVLISPTGVQAVHPDGEVAVARAAAARDVAMGLSCFASKPVEEVAAANPKMFFQTYWVGDRDEILERLDRAKRAGCVGLIATLDWSFSHGRDWGSPVIPDKVDARFMLRFAPEAVTRPRWLYQFARSGKIPDLSVPNLGARGAPAPTFFGAYGAWMGTPPATWEDVAWLREQWDGPFMLKGVVRPDDARRAVDLGATAISVSNHGGNNLDGTPATLRMLPAVARAVGGDVEVLLDGGIRRGSDVVMALALGAKAVMIGRAYLWGLAANGQAGVENVLDIISGGIASVLLGLGVSSVQELGSDHVIVPDGFGRDCP